MGLGNNAAGGREIMTVSQINEYIKKQLERDPRLGDLWVRGEISNCKLHYSGHIYLTLKDEKAVLKAVMFRNSAAGLTFEPKDGMKVLARCRISVYEPAGAYQAYISEMRTDGLGDLHVAFEQLKEKLKKEGLFDLSNKKPIPKFPSSIGVVTSPTGAAVRDIINILGRRYSYAQVLLYPVLVQGEQAPSQIIQGIRYFNDIRPVDVIITGRGGGSIEELWAFNDEGVARAVFASKIPIISAVGHETDFTITDFVADLRAPTPSAAAELAVPSAKDVLLRLKAAEDKLRQLLLGTLNAKRLQMERLGMDKVLRSFKYSIDERRVKTDDLARRLERSMADILSAKRKQTAMEAARLNALSPLAVLSRGYSIAQKKDGTVIRSPGDVEDKEVFRLRLSGGDLAVAALKGEQTDG